MPDAITRDLWLISIAANAGAVAIGIMRRAPGAWSLWAGFYLASAVTLKAIDCWRPQGWYVPVWIAQQIGTVILLSVVTSKTVRPAACLVSGALSASAILGVSLHSVYRWPGSPIEPAMWACGIAALSLGMIGAIGFIARGNSFTGVLAAFLLSYSLLMLAGGDYLIGDGIGRAWGVMEIACFGAWVAVFLQPIRVTGSSY